MFVFIDEPISHIPQNILKSGPVILQPRIVYQQIIIRKRVPKLAYIKTDRNRTIDNWAYTLLFELLENLCQNSVVLVHVLIRAGLPTSRLLPELEIFGQFFCQFVVSQEAYSVKFGLCNWLLL